MLIFPDIEKVLVAYFNEALASEGVRVATKFSQPDEETPDKQLIIIASLDQTTGDRVTRLGSVTLEVYASDYPTASALGYQVEALVRGATINGIKRADVRLGPVRTTEDSQLERRSLDVEVVVQGYES
jgi:hypothetical protein